MPSYCGRWGWKGEDCPLPTSHHPRGGRGPVASSPELGPGLRRGGGRGAGVEQKRVTLEAILARYGLPALFLGAGLEGEKVVVAGGILARLGLVWLPGAMIATAAGSFVADQLFFLAGRRFRDHRWVRKILDKPVVARAARTFERHPTWFILGFRYVYGFRVAGPVFIGTPHVPARTFLLLNAIAAAIWGVTFTTLGYLFGHGLERLIERYEPSGRTLAIFAGVAAVVALAGWLVWRRRARA